MSLPSVEELEIMHYYVCQSVGDTKRLLILYALHEKPRYVTELATLLNTPQPTISRHLAILLERNIVTKARNGPSVVYSLVDDRIISVMDQMRAFLADILANQAKKLQ